MIDASLISKQNRLIGYQTRVFQGPKLLHG